MSNIWFRGGQKILIVGVSIIIIFAINKKRGRGGEGRGGEGRTNERPESDHVTSRPLRGLEKKLHPMAQNHKQTDMVSL